MDKSRLTIIAMLASLLALISLNPVYAQDATAVPLISYYLAADSGGVQQIYQLPLNGPNEPRQITHAESDVITFGVAYDGLGVAYIRGGQLWLQPIHTEEAEALTPLSATQFFSSPVWSQDGQYIAYADDGVWLLDLGTRETRQLLTNVPYDQSTNNAVDVRSYNPSRFVLGDDGTAANLIVDVGLWECQVPGVYDLASGEWQELEGLVHTRLLPLSDGSALLYGQCMAVGAPGLHIADSLEDINTFAEVLDFRTLPDSALRPNQAVQIEPGTVRIFGESYNIQLEETSLFYFDFDVASGEAGSVNYVTLPAVGEMSPDGSLIPVYLSADDTDSGGFKLVDLTTGEEVAANFPETVGVFRWQL
jgi:hypothetical protein